MPTFSLATPSYGNEATFQLLSQQQQQLLSPAVVTWSMCLHLHHTQYCYNKNVLPLLFSGDEATVYVSACPSVTSYFFGLLGATNAVYTALFVSTSIDIYGITFLV